VSFFFNFPSGTTLRKQIFFFFSFFFFQTHSIDREDGSVAGKDVCSFFFGGEGGWLREKEREKER